MTPVLRYGADCSVRLDLPQAVLLGHCGRPQAEALDDPQAAVAEALAGPLNYPALAQITTPGDRVVLALADGVPRAAEIVAATIRCVVGSGVDPDGVTVLRTEAAAEAALGDPGPLLTDQLRQRLTMLVHHPADYRQSAYLAITDGGEPILLSRAVIDADLVLPIGCLRNVGAWGYFGVYGPLYPTFSEQRTQERFHSPESVDGRGRPKKRLAKEADEVGWLLGAGFAIQIVPGPGDGILHVLAGEAGAVRRRGRGLYTAAWSRSVPRRAELVVAAVEGEPAQQTWNNLGRALSAAVALVEDGGSIAVCTELTTQPGPALRQLAAAGSRQAAIDQIHENHPPDTFAATQLARALDRANVYLMSGLEETTAEELGVTPIAGADELARLARRCKSYILLSNAQYATVIVDERAK